MYISYCGLLYFLSVYVFVYLVSIHFLNFIYLFYEIFPIARPCAWGGTLLTVTMSHPLTFSACTYCNRQRVLMPVASHSKPLCWEHSKPFLLATLKFLVIMNCSYPAVQDSIKFFLHSCTLYPLTIFSASLAPLRL